jgi:hypothetical protein
MNKNEIIRLIGQGSLTIAFDTNALFRNKQLTKLCDSINHLNLIEDKYQITLVVPAPAHTEKLRQLKQQRNNSYNHKVVLQGLMDKGINIASFKSCHAEIVAELLYKQFPTDKDWQTFKRQRCIDCLGLGEFKKNIKSSVGKKCSATVDWLIAGYAYAEDCLLVTDDTGKEFKGIDKKTTFDELEVAVTQLLQQALVVQ